MFRNLNFKICKVLDQSSNIKLVALYFPLQLLGSQKFARSTKILEEFGRWKWCNVAVRELSASLVKATAEPSPLPPYGRRIPASLLPARARLLHISRNLPRPGALDPLSPPRDHASRRQAYWPSPLPSTRLFAARPPLPGPASHSSAYPSADRAAATA